MNTFEIIGYVGAIFGIIAHVPMWRDIHKGITGYSFASFALWSFLDLIAVWTTIEQNGNYFLPLAFAVGAGITAIMLLVKGMAKFTKTDGLVCGLIVITLVVWYIFGSRAGLACSIISLVIASIPQIMEFAKEPSKSAKVVYFLFTLSAVLSIFSATAFTLEEIAYSLTAATLCGIMLYLTSRHTPLITKKSLVD
jgi:hypothetical protein